MELVAVTEEKCVLLLSVNLEPPYPSGVGCLGRFLCPVCAKIKAKLLDDRFKIAVDAFAPQVIRVVGPVRGGHAW